jgi:hypothetical protein
MSDRPSLRVVQRGRSGQLRQAAPKVTVPAGGDGPGDLGWAGHGGGGLSDSEVIQGEPGLDLGWSGSGLITAVRPPSASVARRSPVP